MQPAARMAVAEARRSLWILYRDESINLTLGLGMCILLYAREYIMRFITVPSGLTKKKNNLKLETPHSKETFSARKNLKCPSSSGSAVFVCLCTLRCAAASGMGICNQQSRIWICVPGELLTDVVV